jgi:lipoprotein-anchoring transpeptidase ErfK/SrfK
MSFEGKPGEASFRPGLCRSGVFGSKLTQKLLFTCSFSIFLLFLLITGPPPVAKAQDSSFVTQGAIKGKVLSSLSGLPILGVAIRVGETVVPTNTAGEFAFNQVYPGTYTIYFDAPDHEGQWQEAVVESGKVTAIPTVVLSATTGEIRGKVMSLATGQALSGTVVRVDNITVLSEADGEFVFTRVYPGVYTIHYDAASHLSQDQEAIPVYKGALTSPPMAVLSADGPPRIELRIAENRLYLYFGSLLVKFYRVATGMKGWPTPLGQFTIIRKDVNPTWYPPSWADEEKPVRPGPRNPLGNRRLLLSNPSYGIHGTNRISSIGKYITHGCIRLYPWEIVDLFDRVTVGTVVDIVRQ